MSRRESTNRCSSSARKPGNGRKSSKKSLYVVLGILGLAIIGGLAWWLLRPQSYQFQRAHLDKYIELSQKDNLLKDGAGIYVDMSDGMNYAYATPQSQKILQSVINKFAANDAIDFFALAAGKISPLEMSHTQLYNYMLNPTSYDKQQAPIEKTLQQIMEKGQPALLMSDFEEYNGQNIEQAAYAKKYFIDWLARGYNIYFYKWNFSENGKNKIMFLAVFDDNSNRLNSMVENAVKLVDPNIETYVLGGRDFDYPLVAVTSQKQYMTPKQGGNYHNSEGKDLVTAVLEGGGAEDYFCYAKPLASASGNASDTYMSLDNIVGTRAEYYPLGVTWENAITNAKQMQETGVKDKFVHFLSGIAVDFASQNGFRINGIEVRVFDMEKSMEVLAGQLNAGGKPDLKKVEAVAKPEINMVLKAGMLPSQNLKGYTDIFVDFDEKFNGTFSGGLPSTDLIRANIVISKATPNVEAVGSFFTWDGNESLANSVIQTLTAPTSNPEGKVIFTYYLKTVSE